MYLPRPATVPDPTRIAVIGCGYWGMNYLRVLSELPDSRVVVACDQRPERLEEVARRFPSIPLTTDVDEVLAVDGVDGWVVSTQASTHRDVAGRALEAGKHVLVEKPLATSAAEADELTVLAREAERVLLTGHTFLYNPGVEWVRELMGEGSLGDVYYLYSRRTNLGPFRWDVNALWDLAPHDVAIFDHLLDAVPEWVSAVGARVLGTPHEDVGFVSLAYPGGVMAHIHVSWADPEKVREFAVVGSDRRIVFDDLKLERVRVFDRGVKVAPREPTSFGEHLQLRDGDVTSPALPATEPLKRLCGHFLHCIRRGEAPMSPGENGRDVVAVMEAISRSVRQHGAPVAVDGGPDRASRVLPAAGGRRVEQARA